MMRRGFSEAGPVAVSRRMLFASRPRHHASATSDAGLPAPTAADSPQLALDHTSPLAAVMGAANGAPFRSTRPCGFVYDANLVRSRYDLLPDDVYRAAGKDFVAGFNTASNRAEAMPRSPTRSNSPSRPTLVVASRALQLEMDAEPILDTVVESILALKAQDMTQRPSWRAPPLPTLMECDELVAQVRDLAFPEFSTYSLDGATVGATSACSSSSSASSSSTASAAAVLGADESAAAKRQLRNQLRALSRKISSMVTPALLVDALDDATDPLRADADLPDHFHVSKLGGHVRFMTREAAYEAAEDHAHKVIIPAFLKEIASIVRNLNADCDASLRNDVATTSRAEVATAYPGMRALAYHRVSHALLLAGAPVLLSRLISERAHAVTGVDIHPGVQIGPGCFIDHGTGLVIGGTAEIGANVCLFHGVTLGARGFPVDAQGRRIKNQKRHPIIQDGVSIYAGAVVLGRITIGEGATIASGVTVVKDVEPGWTVAANKTTPNLVAPKPKQPP